MELDSDDELECTPDNVGNLKFVDALSGVVICVSLGDDDDTHMWISVAGATDCSPINQGLCADYPLEDATDCRDVREVRQE